MRSRVGRLRVWVLLSATIFLVAGSVRPQVEGPGGAPAPAETEALPRVVDYSKYVTFVRQQGGGGCGTMTSLAILDILAERDYPYSPDFSYRFAAYVYNNPLGKLNQLDVLQQHGCCAEGSLPTNDDPGTVLVPTEEHYREAARYKIAAYSPMIMKPSVDDLRKLLWQYGPLFAAGDTPGSPTYGHVFTLVGYNDDTQKFTALNSYGDRWGSNGLMEMPYANLTNPPPDENRTSPRVSWVRWVQARPRPASPPHPYTCRINIRHNVGRNHLTVKVGAAGEEPKVVWDRPNRVTIVDDSKNLVLDVPLSPGKSASAGPLRWHAVISDDGPPGRSPAATLNDLVFVRRSATGPPVIVRPSGLPVTIRSGGTVHFTCYMR